MGIAMKKRIQGTNFKINLKPSALIISLLVFLTTLPTTAHALRDDVLIIVNDNSIDSPQIGAYYAQQRNINQANIVHVRIRNGYFISWDEFRNLRDQIVAFMQSNTLDDPGLIVANCVDGDLPYYCSASTQQLRQHTRIRYLVTTRGVPTRMTVDGSTLFSPNTATSVDNYLKYWLINYFSSDVKLKFTEREQAFLDGRGMRTVVPSVDKELIVGRIDGLNQEAALNLVDRAIKAEQDGLYGNLFSNTQALHWVDHSVTSGLPKRMYQPSEGILQSWRYQMGVFGESRFECQDYLNFPLSSLSGLTPTNCRVQMTPSTERGPANVVSRQPIANDALRYSGWLDGSISASSFNGLLNWRKTPSCNVVLCENSTTPDACRAASTDIYREINTQCVGVADGFVGYNHQSYPLSFHASWPTGWYPDENIANWNSRSGGDSLNGLAFPDVDDSFGIADQNSLWFRSSDQIAIPVCYSDNSFTATEACPDKRKINLNQKIAFPGQLLDAANLASYRITFWYRAENVTTATDLQLRLFVHESGSGNQQIDYGIQTIGSLPVGNSFWKLASVTITLDPNLHGNQLYDGIKLRLQSSGLFSGDLVIDYLQITDMLTGQNIAENGFFSEGHKQVAVGDYAASFLSRLNGAAFWGSVGHHQSGGAAFVTNQLESMIYFMRGLPLGDAVWFDESNNSGILYGDPLYSPTAVYLHPVNAEDRLLGTVNLIGDTVNGQTPDYVDTQYTVDYCAGTDFFNCDRDSLAWLATGVNGVGGQKDLHLGSWDTSLIIPGEYVLRLAVTSNNFKTGKSQTFYDYYPVIVGDINFPPVVASAVIQVNEDSAGSAQIEVVDQDVGDTHSFNITVAPRLGSAIISASGLVSYTPFEDLNGRDNLSVSVTDSAGNVISVQVTVLINPVNDAPRPTALDILINEDSLGMVQIQANDPDANDTAIYSIVASSILGNATVSSTGLVTFTPHSNATGTAQVIVNVKDVVGASSNVTFMLTVLPINDAPRIRANSMVLLEDSSATTQVLVFDPDLSDTHTYSISGQPSTGVANVSATGMVSYSPMENFTGSDSIGVTVLDGMGGAASIIIPVQVNPVNDVPLVSAPAINTDVNVSALSQLVINDPDIGDTHSYSITTLPLHGTAQVSITGLVNYIPNTGYIGTDQMVLTVTDAAGASNTVLITVTVNSVVTTYTIPNYSSVIIEGTIEEISSVWVTVLGKSVYLPRALITYQSDPEDAVLNIGDHITINADTLSTYLIATTIVRDNKQSTFSVMGPASYIDPENQRLGIAYINVETDNNTNFKQFDVSSDHISSITTQTILQATAQELQSDGSFIARDIEIIE